MAGAEANAGEGRASGAATASAFGASGAAAFGAHRQGAAGDPRGAETATADCSRLKLRLGTLLTAYDIAHGLMTVMVVPLLSPSGS